MKLIADGELLFQGSDDPQFREIGIALPLTKKIMRQIVNHCVDTKSDEVYSIKWEICKNTNWIKR